MTSSAGYSTGRRPGTAYAAAIAARQRRQLIFVIVLALILVAVLAWEIPHLHLFGGNNATTTVAPPVPAPVVTPSGTKSLAGPRKGAAVDPFAVSVSGSDDTVARDVATPPGSVDPFAAAVPTGTSAAATSPLPQQIVIGSPGAGRTASHGWIVIMASIPTGQGRAAAATFAEKVQRGGIANVSILNSSNRRPLRGGYWVVYVGPFATIGEVSSTASQIHSSGYQTAYIRELIVYK
jgi:hypothetical protein